MIRACILKLVAKEIYAKKLYIIQLSVATSKKIKFCMAVKNRRKDDTGNGKANVNTGLNVRCAPFHCCMYYTMAVKEEICRRSVVYLQRGYRKQLCHSP
jgi:hypothetical protein